jgi:chromosomal replication initiator protein
MTKTDNVEKLLAGKRRVCRGASPEQKSDRPWGAGPEYTKEAGFMAAGAVRRNERDEMGDDGDDRSNRENNAAWQRVRVRLRSELGEDVFNSWFSRVDLEDLTAGVVRLSAPTRFLKGWIKSHYAERMVQLWQHENDQVRRVDVEERSALRVIPEAKSATQTEAGNERPADTDTASDRFAGSPLDGRLTFASFCEGQSNEVAYRAAKAVAAASDASAPIYNPLYIHAGVGIGKTHLLQAIAHEVNVSVPGRRVLYLTVERFAFQFVSALRDRAALDFKERLRAIDILMIDDMQFLTGKAVQQEFCHMLNALLDSARQVVVAADRPPSELEGVDERVRSRLKGGVAVGMAGPDSDLRRAILETRLTAARQRNPSLAIPGPVLDYVASVVTTNGRDLDGALNRLVCRAEFCSGPVTMDGAEMAIADLVGNREPRRIRIEEIQKVVARHYNVTKHDLLSARRTRTVVRPRQIAMYLAKTMTPRSFPEIGKRFGGRDHTTVLHAVRKIEGMVAADETLAHEIEFLKRIIQD